MNDELLQLLREAFTEINEMWKVCDKSQADFVLDLETANKFIERALETEDRLDIFRALEKACGVMEGMYNQNDDIDDLIDRLEAARDGLNEHVFMKESELKSLIKMVLKEIYQEPLAPQGLGGFLQSIAQTIEKGHTELTDINQGHEMAHKIVSAIIL